jgi:hypothetical protein
MPVRLEAPLSNGAACLKAAFEGSLRNYYFQILKLMRGGGFSHGPPPASFRYAFR